MSDTPPTSPDDQPERSVQEQLDALLTQIETEEPGTLSPEHLPESFRKSQDAPEPAAPAQPEAVADAVAEFEQAMSGPDPEPAADESQAQADPPQAEPAPEPAAEPQASAEEQDMLAALNSALQGLGGDAAPAEQPAEEPAPEVPAESAPAPQNDEASLQDEISALLSAEPQAADEPAAETTPAPPDAELSTEDQIAAEIEGLLSVEQEPAPANDAPTIDDLDQMLAEEIDNDEELAGEFHSVQDVTAGIETEADDAEQLAVDDVHAATARDVAAELDSQPEDQPFDEDPLAALESIAQTVEENEAAYLAEHAEFSPSWQNRLADAKERLLRACFALNWPARRFLTTEWRANLGYVALLNLFFGVAIWVYLIVR